MLIRTRLTLYFALLLAVALGAFGYVVYEATRASVLAEIERDVRERGVAAVAALSAGRGEGDRVPLDALAVGDVHLQLVDAQGRILERSSSLRDRELPVLREDFAAGRVAHAGGDDWPLYVYGEPLDAGGYLVVGRSPGPLYTVLGRLRAVLLPGLALAVVLSGLVIWLVVRRAMGPLVRLAAAAEDIRARQDHQGRVGPIRRADEIGKLATTIDGMLAALERSHRQVQHSSEAQRRFLADVSHQLRAPLTIMLSSLELVERIGPDDPAYAERLLTDLHAETQRMARMVTQLLVIARADENGAVALRPLLIGEIAADLSRQWTRDPADVSFEPADLEALSDAVVQGSEDHLRQLFDILLENAFKYTPPGGRVRLHGALTDREVRLSVADTGIGIGRDDLPHVFDRFFRANEARRRDGAGMGLGLAIAQHIAERHGGNITVDSSPGAGSRFTVNLPLLQPTGRS